MNREVFSHSKATALSIGKCSLDFEEWSVLLLFEQVTH